MAKLSILKGSTSQTQTVFIQDSTVTTGAGKTGLVFNTAGLTAYYVRPAAAAVAITLATQTVTGAFSSGGFVEIDATNMPGMYRLDLPDAALATGVNSVAVMLKGATGMAPLPLEVELTGWDNQDAVRGGMTSLPASGTLAVNPILNATQTGVTIPTVTTVTNAPANMALNPDLLRLSKRLTHITSKDFVSIYPWRIDSAATTPRVNDPSFSFSVAWPTGATVKLMGIDGEDSTQSGGAAYTIGEWAGTTNEWLIDGTWNGIINTTDILYIEVHLADVSFPESVLTITVPTRIGVNPHILNIPLPYTDTNFKKYINMAVRVDGTIQSWRGGTIGASTIAVISGRIPAALVGGRMDSNVSALNGDATAASNLAKSASVIYQGSVTGAVTTTTLIDSALTQAGPEFWKGRIVIFTNGALKFQATDITLFDPATDKLTFTALTGTPGAGDTYVIV